MLKKPKLKHFLLCCPALFFSFFNHHRRFRLVSVYVRKLLLEISPVRIQEPRGGLSKNNEIIYMSTLMYTDRQEMEPVCVFVCVYVPLYHLCICVRTDVHTKTQLQGNDICYLHSSISLSLSDLLLSLHLSSVPVLSLHLLIFFFFSLLGFSSLLLPERRQVNVG